MYGLNQDSGPNLQLVKTALDKIRSEESLKYARKGKAEATDVQVFTQDQATNAAVVSTTQGGGGYFEKTLDDLSTNKGVSIKSPAPKTTLIARFKKDLDIPETFMEDQQHSSVNKAVKGNTRAWLATRDRNAFRIYSGGFATYTTVDGAYVFSATHENDNGDTIDNLESGALADGTLNTCVVTLRNQVNQTGVKVGYEPDFLLTSNDGHKTGMTTAKSVLRAGTGNNDLNYFSELYPEMKVVYNQFLDDVSTTAFFIGAAGHGITRFERKALATTLVGWETQRNDCYIYKLRAREEVDAIEYSGLVGNTGV